MEPWGDWEIISPTNTDPLSAEGEYQVHVRIGDQFADVSGIGDPPRSVFVPLGDSDPNLDVTPPFDELRWQRAARKPGRSAKPCPPPMASLRTKLRWYCNHRRAR